MASQPALTLDETKPARQDRGWGEGDYIALAYWECHSERDPLWIERCAEDIERTPSAVRKHLKRLADNGLTVGDALALKRDNPIWRAPSIPVRNPGIRSKNGGATMTVVPLSEIRERSESMSNAIDRINGAGAFHYVTPSVPPEIMAIAARLTAIEAKIDQLIALWR